MNADTINGLVIKNGIKNADFLVLNPLGKDFVDESPLLNGIKLDNDKFWQKIKSMAWSSNCRYFFVVNDSSIIIGNTNDNDAFICNSLSKYLFEEFLNAFNFKN